MCSDDFACGGWRCIRIRAKGPQRHPGLNGKALDGHRIRMGCRVLGYTLIGYIVHTYDMYSYVFVRLDDDNCATVRRARKHAS